MPSERAIKLAKQILDDLRGAGYYADPQILGGLLKSHIGNEGKSGHLAVEILRHLLYHHVNRCGSDQDIQELARLLEGSGVS